MNKFKTPHHVAVVLHTVRNNIDRYAKVVENNCIQYTLREAPKVQRYLDSRKVEQMFLDLYGPVGQHKQRSTNDTKYIAQRKSSFSEQADSKRGGGSIMSYRAKYGNSLEKWDD